MENIAVLGPHDRNNYGDFLFPIMLDYAFSKILGETICLQKYSLVQSDFSTLGAFGSKNFRSLNKDVESGKINTIIVAGGESLQARWNNLYSYINPVYGYFFRKEKFRNNKYFRNIPKYILGGKTEYPFIINKDNYKNEIKIIYNAVGSGYNMNQQIGKQISRSDICGLREVKSYDSVKKYKDDVVLIPDSAIIMSDAFSDDKIYRIYDNKYIFFQVSNYKHENKIKEICTQLKKIADISDLDIILCPIGIASGHEDHIILKQIEKQIGNPKIRMYKHVPTISEIMSLIAFSEMYIGTSLHGVITAMSFGVPYIGLNPIQTKLISYLQTWSIPELNSVYNTDNFYEQFQYIQKNDFCENILKETIEQKKLYYDFVGKILGSLS